MTSFQQVVFILQYVSANHFQSSQTSRKQSRSCLLSSGMEKIHTCSQDQLSQPGFKTVNFWSDMFNVLLLSPSLPVTAFYLWMSGSQNHLRTDIDWETHALRHLPCSHTNHCQCLTKPSRRGSRKNSTVAQIPNHQQSNAGDWTPMSSPHRMTQ